MLLTAFKPVWSSPVERVQSKKMHKNWTPKVAVLLVATGLLFTGFTGKKYDDVVRNPLAPAAIKIDGDLSEWGNLVSGYDEKTRLFYAVSNDSKNIYLAIKSENKNDIPKILSRGLTFSVNTEGKKKEGASVVFPVIRRQRTVNPSQNGETIVKEQLASANEIRIIGFSLLPDGGISTSNDYGIEAAAALNEANHFMYELAVPLKHLELNTSSNTPIAIHVKINASVRAAASQPMNVRMGGYGRWNANPSTRSETQSFWIKRTLMNQ